MRLALVTDTYAPRVGGIESQVADLADALRGRGHDVDVLTATPGDLDPGVVRFPGIGGAVPNPLSRKRVREVLAGYDLVHTHMGVLAPFAQAATADALAAGLPTVVTVHSVLGSARAVVGPALVRWARDGAVLSAVSRVAAREVQAATDAPVRVLPNGIDVESWRARPHRPGPRVTFCCTSRLAERKRVVPLVRAFARAVAVLPPGSARLVVVGDGPQASLVREAVRRHRLEGDVDLVGRADHDVLREILMAADAFVSPVRLEAFGIAALEARAAGLPVVGYRGSGVEDLVEEGVTGLLVDGDTGLTDAVVALVRDAALRERLVRGCADRPVPYDWADVVPRVLDVYAQARR